MPTKARLIFQGENRTKQAFNEINGSMAKLKGSAIGVAGSLKGLGAVLAGGLLARAGKDSLAFADQIDKLNARLGASTEFLSQMRFATEQTGVSFQTFTMGLQRMQRRVAEAAQGTGEAKDALRELGIDARKLVELSLEDQFDVIAEALAGLANDGDKTRLAMKLFDSEGVALLQTMEGGAEAVRALREEGDRLGATLTSDMAQGAADANDAINRIGTAVRGIVAELAINFAPAIETVANFLSEFIPRSVNLANAAFATFAGAVGRALAGAVGALAFFVEKIQATMAFLNLPGAESLAGATEKMRNLEAALTAWGVAAIKTGKDSFSLAIGVREVGEAATSSKKDIEELQAATSGGGYEQTDQTLMGRWAQGLQQGPFPEDVEEMSSAVRGLGDSVADSLVDGITRGGQGMKESFRGILADLAGMMLKSALIQGLTNLGFGGIFGGVTGKQAGGAVSGGRAYLVGESGPELFVPSSSGAIMANSLGRAGGGGTVYNIDARGAAPGVGAEIERAIKRAEDGAIARMIDLERRGRFR